ncbi:MAG: SPOR domain-containing protein [Lentimicrobiaceae bacterium]
MSALTTHCPFPGIIDKLLTHSTQTTSRLIMVSCIFAFALLLIVPTRVNAQTDQADYEEITVFLMVQEVGGYEIEAIYMNDNIYINLGDLFNLLKINNIPSKGNDSITGFFLNEQDLYSVNATLLTARVGNTHYKLAQTDIFRTDLGLYLKNTLYGKLFGLNLNFNFRSLSLELKTTHELPVIKELRQEQMRKNIDRLSGITQVDTTLDREYHLFRGGMADWSVISTQATGRTSDTRATLALGSELLGGEATGMLNYSSLTGFDERQQQYRWRWVNNESKIVRQVQAGKIPIKSTSSLYAPVIGASISNTPTTFRKSFGSYILSDYTEPGWTVELYINNVIVDFATADASGFFSFDVPLVYGSSQITLKFYGPWGEERVKEQTINIPYSFLPAGSVEYNITGGMVRDSSNSIFSRAETQVGVHRNITVGAGIEYLSSLEKGHEAMPFMTATARFMNNFLFTGEYTHGVKSRGLLSYRLPSSISFELDYTNYVPGQTAISFNYLEERKASVSIPIHINSFRSFARLVYKQNVLPQTTYSSAEMMLSSYIKGVSTNLSAYANWLPEASPYIYSNIALGFRIGKNLNVRPQVQIDITNNQLISYKAELEKNFSQKAHLSLIFEDNIRSNTRNFEITFRYDLNYAQTSTSARLSGKDVTTTESARGSFAFGSGNGYVHADNRTSTGRGGITITPFLDLNNNNLKDTNEPIATGLSVRLNGGRFLDQKKDSLIRIIELEPYASYLLEFEDTDFENIAWQLKMKAISVQIDPNQFKKINVPVKVMGEANGNVYLKKGQTTIGQGRIIINFFNQSEKLVTRLLTESDGYFNYLGLPPGHYCAVPDSGQLSRLGMLSEPSTFEFDILPMEYGDIIDDITFILTPVNPIEEPATHPTSGIKETGINQKEVIQDSTSQKQPSTEILHSQFIRVGTDSTLQKQPSPAVKPADHRPDNIQEVNTLNAVPQTITQPANTQQENTKPVNKQPSSTQPLTAQPENNIKILQGTYNHSNGVWFVQAGAYSRLPLAKSMYNLILKTVGLECALIQQGPYYKIWFGNYISKAEALNTLMILKNAGIESYIGK